MTSLSAGGDSHNSGSARTLFPRGPSFTLENFSNKDFIVRDFVEELSESAIPANRRSIPAQNAFDPKPLIRHFESMYFCPYTGYKSKSHRCTCAACVTIRRTESKGNRPPHICTARRKRT